MLISQMMFFLIFTTHNYNMQYMYLRSLRKYYLYRRPNRELDHRRHVWLETLQYSNMNIKHKAYKKSIFEYICFDWTPIGLRRRVGLRWVSRGMSISVGSLDSDQACGSWIRHVGLRLGMWVSDKACRSPMGLLSGESSSDWFLMGLQ